MADHWVHLKMNDSDFLSLCDLAKSENLTNTDMVRVLVRRATLDPRPRSGPDLESAATSLATAIVNDLVEAGGK